MYIILNIKHLTCVDVCIDRSQTWKKQMQMETNKEKKKMQNGSLLLLQY